ncbi:MAG: transglycosylase SLT domain-containing protein [Campylobacterota bacterium]|nr:transglycosylase SLT domain-containing protein [Campylobacterota bacterium]
MLLLLGGCSSKSLYQKFNDIARQNNVNHKILMAICKKESNLKPYVINVNKSIFNIQKGPHSFDTWIGANSYMDFVLDPMLLNYDIGICQINTVHLTRFDLDNEDLLDTETNIQIAAKIYNWNLRQCKGDIVCALSMYNTGYKNSTIGKRYAKKVLEKKREMFNE